MKIQKLVLILSVLSCLVFLCFATVFGLLNKYDSLSDSYSFAVVTAPYGLDAESIDRDELHKVLSEVIDVPFSVGVAKDYATGYPDVMITTRSEASLDSDKIVSKLNEKYPEFSVESLDSYSFEKYGNQTINVSLVIQMLLVAIVFLVLCFAFIKQ